LKQEKDILLDNKEKEKRFTVVGMQMGYAIVAEGRKRIYKQISSEVNQGLI